MDIKSLQKTVKAAEKRLSFCDTEENTKQKPTRQQLWQEEEERRLDDEENRHRRSNVHLSPRRLQKLATDRSDFYRELEARKHQEESKWRSSIKTSEDVKQETCTRLFQDSQRREERLAQLRNDLIPEDSETFHPRVTEKAKHLPVTPLPLRAQEVLEKRSEKIMRLKFDLESQQDQQRRHVDHKVNPDELTVRLQFQAEKLKERKERYIIQALEEERRVGTPSIDNRSRWIASAKLGNLTFLERQQQVLALKQERLEQLKKEQIENEVKLKENKKLSPNSLQRTVEKLSKSDAKLVMQKRQEVADAFIKQFPFSPQISERSKQLASSRKSSGFENLYRNAEGFQRRQDLKHKIEEERMRECTFRPLVGSSSTRVSLSTETSLMKRNEERSARLAKIQMEREMRELKECTFRPAIKSNAVNVRESVTVKGMDAFLNRKKLAKELKEQQKEREEKAFLVKSRFRPTRLSFG